MVSLIAKDLTEVGEVYEQKRLLAEDAIRLVRGKEVLIVTNS